MALVSHTIVSRYTPQHREPVTLPVEPQDDPWQTESSFGRAQRLHSRSAPLFVAASLEYDEYGMPKTDAGIDPAQSASCDVAVEDVSAWYRSLTGKDRKLDEQPPPPLLPPNMPPATSPSPSSDIDTRHGDENIEPSPGSQPASHRRNWFTAQLPSPDHPQRISKPSTLADLLSRNPPPLSSEPAFKPPVFLVLGPANKGFAMLQRKGWREGEGLGSARVEQRPREGRGVKRCVGGALQQEHGTEAHKSALRPPVHPAITRMDNMNPEVIDLTSDSEHDAKRELVDLTLSDSELESDVEPDLLRSPEISSASSPNVHGMTLLTPLTTTLKADRLGIGLKAARPSSAKAKAVTHTSAALAAHIRAGNQARKEKAGYGRRSRGFARRKRQEERERVGMLAYMNS